MHRRNLWRTWVDLLRTCQHIFWCGVWMRGWGHKKSHRWRPAKGSIPHYQYERTNLLLEGFILDEHKISWQHHKFLGTVLILEGTRPVTRCPINCLEKSEVQIVWWYQVPVRGCNEIYRIHSFIQWRVVTRLTECRWRWRPRSIITRKSRVASAKCMGTTQRNNLLIVETFRTNLGNTVRHRVGTYISYSMYSDSHSPMRLKIMRKWSASEVSAPDGPLSAAGRRPSGVTSDGSIESTLPEPQGIVGPPIALIAATVYTWFKSGRIWVLIL